MKVLADVVIQMLWIFSYVQDDFVEYAAHKKEARRRVISIYPRCVARLGWSNRGALGPLRYVLYFDPPRTSQLSSLSNKEIARSRRFDCRLLDVADVVVLRFFEL